MADQPDKWREPMAETDPEKQKAKPGEAPPGAPMPAETIDSRPAVLVVDDDPAICALFRRMLSRRPFTVLTAETGPAALDTVRRECGRIDVALVDFNLGAEENGLELLKRLRAIDDEIVGVVLTGQATLDNAVAAFQMGIYDFIQKPVAWEPLVALLDRAVKYRRLVRENKRYQLQLENRVREQNAALILALEEVKESYQFTLEAMAAMLDAREQKTGEHSKRVAEMALVLAREMGVTPEEVQTIRMGALLHDIGKIAVPDSILLKPGALTPDERAIMRKHAQVGYDIIQSSPVLRPAAEIVISHHERYDGTGYPRGLKGDAICLGARIFAVIDTYDAIRADRSYSKGRSSKEAVEEILRHRGTQFDPAVVDALLRCQAGIEEISREPPTERTP